MLIPHEAVDTVPSPSEAVDTVTNPDEVVDNVPSQNDLSSPNEAVDMTI